jgi:hypothetical protein
LVTDLSVRSREEAIEKINWYTLRWKIEVFHKILKSGCKAEDTKLQTAERLTNLIAVFCILAWRIFWMTMINRSADQASPRFALTAPEIELLDHLVKISPCSEQVEKHSHTTSRRSHNWAVISREPTILHRETPLCGEGFHV